MLQIRFLLTIYSKLYGNMTRLRIFFDYLGSIANQELADVGTEWFEDADREFHRTPDLTDCTSATMEALIENAERTDMVATNIGNVPIEDYREIVATQNGF